MENIVKNIQDHIKGVCTIEIYDEKGNKVIEKKQENTLNNNFIWDMCRQQLFRSNVDKRKMSPLGGVILTKSGIGKDANLPGIICSSVAGYASLYRGGQDGTNIKEGYSNSTLIQCKDGEFTFEFVFGPNKELGDFDTIWLYTGQNVNTGSSSADGVFFDMIGVDVNNFPTGYLGCSNNGYVYALNGTRISQYMINLSSDSKYNFVLVNEIDTDDYDYKHTHAHDDSNTAAFSSNYNCFIVFKRDNIYRIGIDGKIGAKSESGLGYIGYSGAICYGDFCIRMENGLLRVYDIETCHYVSTIITDVKYSISSTIYIDSTNNIVFIKDGETKDTDIYLIDKDLNLYFLYRYKGKYDDVFTTLRNMRPMGCLGQNYFAADNGGLCCSHIFPCTQDVIYNAGSGELVTMNKPLGYSARVIYKIYFTFNDTKDLPNNVINPRAFQDMFLNMLLPNQNCEGLNVFGSFMVCDNGKDDGLTNDHTKRTGFAYSYSQNRNIHYPTLQGLSDLSTAYINKKLGKIQLKYEFDYSVANDHFTHIQAGTNAMIVAGMNNPDGRCYAPKIVSEFGKTEAQNLINNYGHKIFCGVAEGVAQKFYILGKNAKNTIYKLNINLFDNEYMSITSDLSNGEKVLEEVNLNDDEIYQVLHLTTTRNFYAFSKQKMYIYDEDFNFIEHQSLPFIDDNIDKTTKQLYFGFNELMIAFITQDNVDYIICYDYINKNTKWKIRADSLDYYNNQYKIGCFGSDGEYVYINMLTTINAVQSYYILTFRITDDGLELETFNQSRCMASSSLIYTKGFPTKYFFIEVSDFNWAKDTYKDDISNQDNRPAIYLCKSFPYITATHKINVEGTKTENDYFEGVFELKM